MFCAIYELYHHRLHELIVYKNSLIVIFAGGIFVQLSTLA